MDGEDWCGLAVRIHERAVVGVVVGIVVEGPFAGCLQVQGDEGPERLAHLG
jgi:hypothetical protein